MSASSCSKVSCQMCFFSFLVLCLYVFSFSVAQWNQHLCVYATWLTCFRAKGCWQRSNRVTSPLSDHRHRQEEFTSHQQISERLFSVKACLCGLHFLRALFVPSLCLALYNQLCVLTLPASASWSTCSRRAGC